MEQLGTDFNSTGSVMNRQELEELRKKRGECVSCGRKCFRKKLFKFIPIDDHGRVLNGRCLNCHPLDAKETMKDGSIPAVSRPATKEDLLRFSRSQSNLALKGPGMISRRNTSLGISDDNAPPPAPSSQRKVPPRAASGLPRISDNRSVGPPINSSPRNLGPRSLSMKPPAPSLTAMTDQSPRSASTQVSSGSESQPLPLPAPPTESPFLTRAGSGINGGSGHSSQDGVDLLSRFAMGNTRRSITATRSGQSLRSQDSNSNHGARMIDINQEERVPTAEELQRAAETLLAAKKYGLHEDVFQNEAYQDIRDLQEHIEQYGNDQYREHYAQHLEYEADLGGHAGSNRSLRSASTLGDGSDDANEFAYPRHGILNRGGEIAFQMASPSSNGSARQVGGHVVSGSSRTLSSMSSIEEDPMVNGAAYGRRTSVKVVNNVNAVDALYEETGDDCSISVPSRASAAHSHDGSTKQTSSRNTMDSGQTSVSEHHYVERLRMAGNDYSEILIILREAISSPIVIREGLEELSCLQLNAHDQDMLTDMGAPHVIVDVMHAHAKVLEVQLWGCGAVWNMSGTLRNQVAFVDSGALDLILEAMDRFRDSIDVQEKAIATLSNLGAAEENLAILVERGAVSHIVDAMNKHSDIGSVQIKGCSAITNLASHNSPLKQQIMNLGGGGAVVISMVMHPDDFYLQEKALRALRNLCANNEENKRELANIGGIDAVISAMQVHRDEPGVQEEGAWTLSNLAGNDDNKAVIGDCGGIDVIIRAMWVHSDNVAVQEWCCRALFTLTLDAHNGNIVLEVGGISAVVNAMQAHVDSPAVQEMGCAVLSNLAISDNSKMRIVDEEALDAIVLAMVLYTDDSQVQERACMVLLRLAIGANFKSMLAANIGELVRVAAGKFPEKCEEPARRLLHVLEGY